MKMKRKLPRIAALLLTLVMCLTLLTGCGEKGKVKALISDFESACQSADVSKMLDCLDPEVAKPVKGVMSLLGIDASKISDLLDSVVGGELFGSSGIGELLKTDNLEEELATLEIKPESYAFNKAKDECSVQVTYSGTFRGEEFSKEGELTCVLRDKTWYLAAF